MAPPANEAEGLEKKNMMKEEKAHMIAIHPDELFFGVKGSYSNDDNES
jgi:hypothetical protein